MLDGGTVPAEHGFRCFPGFYRNLRDTMARIPCGSGVVADNLLATAETLIAATNGRETVSETRTPRSIAERAEAFKPIIGGGNSPLRRRTTPCGVCSSS